MRPLVLLPLVFVLLTGVAKAQDCPQEIRYQGGSYLKRDDIFYYPSGSHLLRDAQLYYPDGSYIWRDDVIYYPGGSSLRRDDILYYPSGAFLKREDTYYYSNSSYLKFEDNFYYSNGAYARRDGALYHADGTPTVFPVVLDELIDLYGQIHAVVRPDTATIEVIFDNLIATPLVYGSLKDDPTNGLGVYFEIGTGYPNETVLLYVGKDGRVTCELAPPPY